LVALGPHSSTPVHLRSAPRLSRLCSSSSSLAEAEAAAPAAAKLFPIPFELHLSSFVGTLLGKHSTSDDEERSLQPEEVEQEELDWE
jgi:hypothetical protein